MLKWIDIRKMSKEEVVKGFCEISKDIVDVGEMVRGIRNDEDHGDFEDDFRYCVDRLHMLKLRIDVIMLEEGKIK